MVELDGEKAGVIGLALTRPQACLFCAFDEALRPYLKSLTVMRLVKRVKTLIEERGKPVMALREPDEDKAPALLARLGFKYIGIVDGDEAYEWNPD